MDTPLITWSAKRFRPKPAEQPTAPITIPNLTFGLYRPTAPVNLTNLFPNMSNPYMSGLFNTGYNAPSMPSFNNMGGFYGASRFLNPGVTSGLLNTGMMTAPTQTTTSNL